MFIRVFVNWSAETHSKCTGHRPRFCATQGTFPTGIASPLQRLSFTAISAWGNPSSLLSTQSRPLVNLPKDCSPSSVWTFRVLNTSGTYYTFLFTCFTFLKSKTTVSLFFWSSLCLECNRSSTTLAICKIAHQLSHETSIDPEFKPFEAQG